MGYKGNNIYTNFNNAITAGHYRFTNSPSNANNCSWGMLIVCQCNGYVSQTIYTDFNSGSTPHIHTRGGTGDPGSGSSSFTWTSWVTTADLVVKTVNATLISSPDWTVTAVFTYQSGKVVSVRIDANAKTTNNAWVKVASGLPAPSINYFYQMYDDGNGPYKIEVDTSGNLYLSNRSGNTGIYTDTAISYIAK